MGPDRDSRWPRATSRCGSGPLGGTRSSPGWPGTSSWSSQQCAASSSSCEGVRATQTGGATPVLVARATARAWARCARRRRPRRTPPIAMPTPPTQPSTSATTTPGAPGTRPRRPQVRTANDAASRMPRMPAPMMLPIGALLATGQRSVRRLEREDRVEREEDRADHRRSQQWLLRADACLRDRLGIRRCIGESQLEVSRTRSDEPRAAEVEAHLGAARGACLDRPVGVEDRATEQLERRLHLLARCGRLCRRELDHERLLQVELRRLVGERNAVDLHPRRRLTGRKLLLGPRDEREGSTARSRASPMRYGTRGFLPATTRPALTNASGRAVRVQLRRRAVLRRSRCRR